MAGPIARARLNVTPLSAIARSRSRSSTSAGMSACIAGIEKATPTPITSVPR